MIATQRAWRTGSAAPWRPAWRWWPVYWLLIGATIVGTGLPRLSHGTWVWRLGRSTAGVYGGIPMDWEWVDIAQSAWFAEGDPRWGGRLNTALKGQNALRFVPGLAVSWLGVWTRDAWRASVLATWLCWLATAWAIFELSKRLLGDPARGRRVGAVAAALVALSPGFAAFIGNMDPHPFGYAAAALALLALETARAAGWVNRPGDRVGAPWVVGAVLFLANGALELGPLLLAMVWLFYVVAPALLEPATRRPGWRERARWAAAVSATYFGLQTAWWATANVASLGSIHYYNEGLPLFLRSLRSLSHGLPERMEITGKAWITAGDVVQIFTAPVAALFVLGLFVLPRRAACWAALWVALVVGAALTTRNLGRVQYLAFPGMYVAAAAAVEWGGSLVADFFRSDIFRGRFARSPRLPRIAAWGQWGLGTALRWALPVWLLYAVGRVVLGDLRGDLSVPAHWWPP